MLPATLGSSDAWNAMLYGETSQQTISYMQDKIAAAQNLFTAAGNNFMQRAENAFNLFNGAEAINFARRTLSKIANFYDPSRITEFQTLSQFQNAGLGMQRWIMAEPAIRKLYHGQRCDGYSESYIDMHPNDIGIDHYDWRLVNNTVVHFKPDGGYVAQQFADELIQGDRALTFSEQCAVLATWDALEAYAEQQTDDPTSSTGGKF